jgi:glycosyltransferase involved in cell wall biosynthesis
MRVMFFNPSLYAIGGMQAWLAGLMPDLRARGWEVWLALPTGPHNDAQAYLRNYPWEPHVLVDNPTCSRVGRLRAVQRALGQVRPDVLVVANLVTAYHAIEDLRSRGEWAPRLVACNHTLDGGIFADLRRFRPILDALVAPNRLIAAAAEEVSGIDPGRIHYAPYRVDAGPPPTEPAGDGPLTLAFVHRLDHEQKRALDLPPLMHALAARGVDARLEVVGHGPAEETLRAAFSGEVAAGRVRFLGAVPPAELRERVLRPGHVLLVMSSWEFGPLVAWQAMAWGALVVSSRFVGSGLEGFLRDGDNALTFPLGDVDAAADAIARLRDPALRMRLMRQAAADVRRHFASEVATTAWDEALRGACAREPLPRPPAPAPVAPAGRLDRILGVGGAELLRRALRRRVPTSGPGDEWPHTEGGGLSPAELLARLTAFDAPASLATTEFVPA